MAEDRIGRASVFLASGTIVSRILGFVKTIVLTATIGMVGSGANAFAIATQLPNTIYAIVGGGVLSAVLVPQIVRASRSPDGGERYINKLVTVALVILAGVAIIATLAAPLLTILYGPKLNDETRQLATLFAFWSLPQIFFYGLYSVLGEVLNARRSFGPFTWVPVINNLVGIAGMLVFAFIFGADPTGSRAPSEWTGGMIALLAGATTLGVALQALTLFWFWKRIGLRFRPDFGWRGVGLGAAGKIAGWTFGMLLLTTFAGIVETGVSGGAADTGDPSVAALNNAWLIFMLPHSVITVSIATAYFTRLSEHAAAADIDRVRADLSSALRGIGSIIVIAAAVIMVVAYPFGAVYGLGDLESIAAFGNIVIAYLIGLIGFSALFVVQRTFYALNDTRTPFFFTLFQVVLFTGGALYAGTLPTSQIAVAIALTTTIAGTAQLVLAAVLLRRKLRGIDLRHVLASYLRYVAAAIVPVAVGIGLLVLLGGTSEGGFALATRAGAIVSMIVIGAAMSLLYFATLWFARVPEFRGFAEAIIVKLRRR
ncbi:murein biosynthesis integral membrane protein MurJ [Agromyces cerinus]|uniref:Putative peptidoglycan lipid II flippase n=1 Tax=Agromyces cerinus subsp. cerinus TaxID=232089 RepID=A0A1N6G376_9MICO|nr:murein biosynthesis integral membrane protein MurJ [Agromyces cerinus]SIO01989.1 putative peptidoglycan lipid II flippase [Agromyces cerinus subsp. cerinus]